MSCDIDGIDLEYRGILSIEYGYKILVSGITSRVLSLMSKGSHIRINLHRNSGESFLVEGSIVGLYTYTNQNKTYTRLTIQDIGYKKLIESMYTGFLTGELSGVIKTVVGTSNVRKRYSGIKKVHRHVSGRHVDIISDLVRDNETLWNVRGDVIWIGDILSDRLFDISSSKAKGFFGKVRDADGNIIKLTDVQLDFKSEIRPGDILEIEKNSFIVVVVVHQFAITQDKSLHTTYIKMVSNTDDAFNLVRYYDSERRIEEISDFRKPLIIYDSEYNELSYYDHDRIGYLADLQEKSFVLHTVLGATYLDYTGGIATSATAGVYIPYDVIIVGVGIYCDGTDDAVVRVRRNGVDVSLVSIADRIPKYEVKNDVFGKDGLMSVYVSVGGGFVGFNYAIVNVYYRRVVKYE